MALNFKSAALDGGAIRAVCTDDNGAEIKARQTLSNASPEFAAAYHAFRAQVEGMVEAKATPARERSRLEAQIAALQAELAAIPST